MLILLLSPGFEFSYSVEVGYIADVAHELAAWVKPILHKKCTPAGKLKQCLKNCNRGVLT
jgi:hypothetical protein